jgi:hypothetical protein
MGATAYADFPSAIAAPCHAPCHCPLGLFPSERDRMVLALAHLVSFPRPSLPSLSRARALAYKYIRFTSYILARREDINRIY